MSGHHRFLWLEGIFDENTVSAFPAISPASNFWQRGFINALHGLGHEVDVVGYPVERVWPLGRLSIRREQARLAPGMTGRVVGFVNLPLLRNSFQYAGMLSAIKAYLDKQKPDYQIVFSCLTKATEETPAIKTAKYIRKKFGVPWICIVADGEAPPGADGYVFLAWSYYQAKSGVLAPSIHIDGGIPDIKQPAACQESSCGREKVLMYMGALTPHGGVSQLARAFNKLSNDQMRLWICGRGENPELAQLAEIDPRIKVLGFLEEDELNEVAGAAFAFANPRSNSFAPNKLNYPSKLLHYLAYGKPIISSFTDGVSPEYEDVLIPIGGDSEDCLVEVISTVLNLEAGEYEAMQQRIGRFNRTHTWEYQISRFLSWLEAGTGQRTSSSIGCDNTTR